MGAFSWELGGLTLADVCEDVRIQDPGGGGFSDAGHQIPYRPGVLYDPEASFLPLQINLRTILKADKPDEYLQDIKAELAKRGLVVLKATLPNVGAVRAQVKQVARAMIGEDRNMYYWPLTIPSGSWQDQAESNSGAGNPPSVTTGGDREIHDPLIVFSGAGQFTHTDSDGVQSRITLATGPTFPVTVDVGAGTITDNTGADASGAATITQPWWIRFEADLAQTIATTVSCTVRWRNRHG